MGCPAELLLEAEPALCAAAIAAAQAEIARLQQRYSHYQDDSLLGQLASAAGGPDWIALSAEDEALFALADVLHQVSGGRFDPSAGPLLRLWDFRRAQVPSASARRRARALLGWNDIEREPGRARLPRAGMRLDFGGLVKEYAADRAAESCRRLGVRHGLVDLGGDIAVIGAHADGRPWQIGVRDPAQPQRAVASLALDHGGLASSGTYARMFAVDGHCYSHLLDPISGLPIEGLAAVSVCAGDCLSAGAVATVALLLGREHGENWLQSSGLRYLCVAADTGVANESSAVACNDHAALPRTATCRSSRDGCRQRPAVLQSPPVIAAPGPAQRAAWPTRVSVARWPAPRTPDRAAGCG